jgi:tetratricopeptide (TPR) repeat protein
MGRGFVSVWILAGRVVVRSALMSIRVVRVLIVVAACLTALGGCSSSAKLSDLWASKGSETPSEPAAALSDTTGTVVVQPAEPGPSGEPVATLAKPGLLGDDPNDDVQLGKKYFRSNNFGLAEKSFRNAVEKHPRDAEAWVGLAASYDRLHRFDLADRAYVEATRIVGPTPEILNNQGFSYMLRGDYERARKKLDEAQNRDPGNPYIQANMRLLQDSYREGKAVQ